MSCQNSVKGPCFAWLGLCSLAFPNGEWSVPQELETHSCSVLVFLPQGAHMNTEDLLHMVFAETDT